MAHLQKKRLARASNLQESCKFLAKNISLLQGKSTQDASFFMQDYKNLLQDFLARASNLQVSCKMQNTCSCKFFFKACKILLAMRDFSCKIEKIPCRSEYFARYEKLARYSLLQENLFSCVQLLALQDFTCKTYIFSCK